MPAGPSLLAMDGSPLLDHGPAEPPTWWCFLTFTQPSRRGILLGAYAVLFTRYCVATMLCSFFTPIATDLGISATWIGLIYAAYPIGMALTSTATPTIIAYTGANKAVSIGLVFR